MDKFWTLTAWAESSSSESHIRDHQSRKVNILQKSKGSFFQKEEDMQRSHGMLWTAEGFTTNLEFEMMCSENEEGVLTRKNKKPFDVLIFSCRKRNKRSQGLKIRSRVWNISCIESRGSTLSLHKK